MKFFAWLNDQQEGPFDEEVIQQMISDGKIVEETLLCPEGGDLDWTPAKELLALDLSSLRNSAKIFLPGPQAVEKQTATFSNKYEDNGKRLAIRLTSGLELKIKSLRLYDELLLVDINSKRTEALKNFKGVSTGLGSIGSIEWVLAASAVIGVVEGALSAAAASSGKSLLAEVIRLEQKLRNEGVFIPVGKVENMEVPIPGVWRMPYEREGQIQIGVDFWGKPQYENRQIPSALIHSGEEFVVVQDEDDSTHSVRWSAVEHYICHAPDR